MILAIDTSSNHGDLAVATGSGEAIFHAPFRTERSHNSTLFPLLEEMLTKLGDRTQLSHIIVGTGPGSYTGCRIGIAAAQALGLALGIPIIGAPSIVGIPEAPEHFAVCGDARRGSFFYVEVEGGKMISAPTLGNRDFLEKILHKSTLPVFCLDARAPLGDHHEITLATVSALTLAARTPLEESSEPLAPIYLAPPFVTSPKTRTPKT